MARAPDSEIGRQREALRRAARARDWKQPRADELLFSELERRPAPRLAVDTVRGGRQAGLVLTTFGDPTRCLLELGELLSQAHADGWALAGLEVIDESETAIVVLYATFLPVTRDWAARQARAALEARRARGEHIGRRQQLPDETVERIVHAKAEGKSLRAIAAELNAERVPTAHGGARWYASTIQRVLSSQAAERVVADAERSMEEQYLRPRKTTTSKVKDAEGAPDTRGERERRPEGG